MSTGNIGQSRADKEKHLLELVEEYYHKLFPNMKTIGGGDPVELVRSQIPTMPDVVLDSDIQSYEKAIYPYGKQEEDEELAILNKADEVLDKMEDFLNNEPMTNMERHRGVEHAYYDKSEVGDVCEVHKKPWNQHTEPEYNEDMDMFSRMRDEQGTEIDYGNLQLLIERDRRGELTQEDKNKLFELRKRIYGEGKSEQAGTCSQCGGELYELGTLGSVTHYRCRNCGADFSSKPKTEGNEELLGRVDVGTIVIDMNKGTMECTEDGWSQNIGAETSLDDILSTVSQHQGTHGAKTLKSEEAMPYICPRDKRPFSSEAALDEHWLQEHVGE